MHNDSRDDFTGLLAQFGHDDRAAAERLFPLVYDELRRLAGAAMSGRVGTPTLQPTALVHEAYVKLAGGVGAAILNREHFLALAARVMRQVLVDHVRATKRDKRGAGAARVTLSDVDPTAPAATVDVLELEVALEALAREDASKARLVELKFFAGLTNEEAAKVLGTSPSTVVREWRFTRAWLASHLSGGGAA